MRSAIPAIINIGRVVFRFLLTLSLLFPTHSIAEKKKIQIIAEEFAPYEFVQNGQVVGIDIDICNTIFQRMGYEPEYKIMPWKRAWFHVQEGLADVILTTSRKAVREPYVWYPEEDMWAGEFVLFFQKGRFKKEQLTLDFARKHQLNIGIIQGNSYHASFWQQYPYQDGSHDFLGDMSPTLLNKSLIPVESLKQNLLKVAHGRVDLTIANRTYGEYTAKLLGLNNQIDASSVPLYSKRYPLAFIKKSPNPEIREIYKAFDKELRALKESGEYAAIFAKWLK